MFQTVLPLSSFIGDASEQAFCSVVYFRFSYATGSVKCAFVTAKTRVAPKKPLSIPRLELGACSKVLDWHRPSEKFPSRDCNPQEKPAGLYQE